MKSLGAWRVPPLLMAVYVAGLVGFAVYTRAFLAQFGVEYGTTITYGEFVLEFIGSGHVVTYLLFPVAAWCAARQVQENARPSDLVRYATRTDWAFGQGLRALPSVLLLVGLLLVVALVGAIGHEFTWLWGQASRDPGVVLQLPELGASLPLPVLSLALQLFALCATLVALVVVTAAPASRLGRPHVVTSTVAVLLLWSIVSFRTEGWLAHFLGPSTYALPARAVASLPFGVGGGVMLLLVGGALAYCLARWTEVHRLGRVGVPRAAIPLAVGAATLAVLVTTVAPDEHRTPMLVLLLQGISTDGLSFVHYLANALLVLVPAIVLHQELISALSGRRYAEMSREASPAHWYGRRLGAAAVSCGVYGLALAMWAIVLVSVRTRAPAELDTVVLAVLWGLALVLQVLAVTVLFALVTALVRRVEGAAYVCLAILALSLPLGAVSRWIPVGQASLSRLTDIAEPGIADLHFTPLLALALWLAVLGAATLVLFNRTRGEIV
jgi:hypothetical protein